MNKNLILKCAFASYTTSAFALFLMTCYYINMIAEASPRGEIIAAFMG